MRLARLTTLVLLLSSRPSLAQTEPQAAPRSSLVTFDPDVIDGNLSRPDQMLVQSRLEARHRNLIQLRTEFRQKVLESATRL